MIPIAQNWFFWALGSAVFAALTAVFAKVGITGIDSNLATLIRTLTVVPLAAGVAWFTGALQAPSIPGRSWVFLLLSGAGAGASWLCYFRALQLGDVGRVAPVDKLSLVLVALFAALFLGETLNWLNWLGIGFVLAGVILIAIRD